MFKQLKFLMVNYIMISLILYFATGTDNNIGTFEIVWRIIVLAFLISAFPKYYDEEEDIPQLPKRVLSGLGLTLAAASNVVLLIA